MQFVHLEHFVKIISLFILARTSFNGSSLLADFGICTMNINGWLKMTSFIVLSDAMQDREIMRKCVLD